MKKKENVDLKNYFVKFKIKLMKSLDAVLENKILVIIIIETKLIDI